MRELIIKSELYRFATIKEFAEEFRISEDDLILTNEWIFKPFLDDLGLPAHVMYQEKYGAGEPTDIMIDAILENAAKASFKRIIAIGGGTIIDIAKVMAVSKGQTVDDLYDNMANLEKKRELIIIPTTCGTGSEVTNISIINRLKQGTKMGLVSDSMFADYAVLVPELLKSLPYEVFATSSIDALIHAVESCLSPKATPYSKLFGYKAIEILISGYQTIADSDDDSFEPLLEDFLIASNYAGIAFGTAGVGAVHAMSYPLGGTYHVSHGESNYALFTGVLRNYMEIKQDGEIAVMNMHLSDLLGSWINKVYDELDILLNKILPKKALREYGVTDKDLSEFTEAVIKKQTRLMANNFVPLDKKRVRKIYGELH